MRPVGSPSRGSQAPAPCFRRPLSLAVQASMASQTHEALLRPDYGRSIVKPGRATAARGGGSRTVIEAGRRVEFVRAISIARPAIRAVRTKKLKRRMAESTKVHPTCDSVKIPPRGFGDCVAPDQTEARPVSWSSQLLLLRHRICLGSLGPRAESNGGTGAARCTRFPLSRR